jgi:hypothetical protein
MEYAADLTYTKSVVRSGIFHYWRKTIGWIWPTSILLLLIMGSLSLLGDAGSWTNGLLAGVAMLSLAMILVFLVSSYRQGMSRLAAMTIPKARITCTEQKLSLQSDAGNAEVPWNAIKKIWSYPDVWLLFYSDSQFSTLPVQDVSLEMREFIKGRVVSAGGKVIS